ncbi:hypothetical protein [Shewanella glacialimarina]|jgi:hypothetical protein|uniref:hypothetical protein n=1 Tax=Shewanella glacialimarina TaxID=2590884 RepID=UPI001CF80348|nr:hypothetical protein [Shewanella glacialimarina]UCX04015.1 hypothetical protein FJ709_05525 [Shewanella glacialimarina]
MKSWLNKILGREPMLVRRKVQVDLRYHSYRFSMDDFKHPNTDSSTNTDELASAENQACEIASSTESSIK